LITAAGEAFNTAGYFGTDTNRIARQAGFAPQTFYRHFTDKLEIFLAVYERWRADEAAAIAAAIKRRPGNARASAAATAIIQHHRDWAMFRRSLRLLAVEEPRVRVARAAGREAQLAALGALPANAGRSKVERAAALLTVERLCDALADGEPQDLGIKDSHWIALVAKAVAAARGE
jgi:AcrR family transcriptional regulator